VGKSQRAMQIFYYEANEDENLVKANWLSNRSSSIYQLRTGNPSYSSW